MSPPFPIGIPVRGKDLIGRKEEINKIVDIVSDGQSVILIAPRRFGKTSILLEVLRRVKEKDVYVGDVDIFRIISCRELAEKITDTVLENRKIKGFTVSIRKGISSILKKIEYKHVINDFEFVLKLGESHIDENELLDAALTFPDEFASKYKKKMVFAYDEFGDLDKLNGEALLKRMRAIFQRQQNVSYIFSGSQESLMTKIFSNKKQAFYKFGRVITLQEINKRDFEKYIKRRFSQMGVSIDRDNIDIILQKTEGHPYYTQLICHLIYYSIKNRKCVIEQGDIKSGFIEAMRIENSYFEELWQGLKGKKDFLKILRFIADEHSNPYKLRNLNRQQIYYILSSLVSMGMIKKIEKASYKIINPLFRDYLSVKKHFTG